MVAPRVPRESERRHATVLFADISGFTAMAEKLDPEEVTHIVNECFASLGAAVQGHGGHVDKYIGDCVMALFGVPAALEKAPQQAINAAIEMRDRLAHVNREVAVPVRLELHTGINTGLVIAGHVGGEVKQEFTVMGDAVNLASRLKDAAPNGAIYVGAETYRAVRDEFEFRKLAPLALKGKERPVEAYEVLSRRQRVHRARPVGGGRTISSPLVGRDAELALLRACFGAVARGEGGIVDLVAEPGLGKSRLLAEACATDEARAVTVLEGRSLAIGQGRRFHPFVDLLRHWAGIGDDDDEPASAAKLEAAVGDLVGEARGEIFPFVATLMGVRLTGVPAERVAGIAGEALETLVQRSVRELFTRLAAVRPLVLVFEDLHWADRSSIHLLESLLRLAADHPILFVHAFRPHWRETGDRIRAVGRERHAARRIEIALEPLDAAQVTTLVHNLLKTEDVPYSTVALISRTAEGNPFYVEEVLRSFIDDGVVEPTRSGLRLTERIDSVVIPGTIQGVIMARVDRLPEAARDILQVASVIGRSVYHRVLAAVAPPDVDLDRPLAYLKERELLLERRTRRTSLVRRHTLAEEVEYVFKHALLQETVYESLLQKTRKELHRAVAEAIESAFAERLADFYAMLAYHYSRAEDLEKAEEFLFRAGDEAASSAASSEALAFFREASRLYFLLNGEGGDPRKKSLLEKSIALALLNKGQLTESIEHFDRALEHLGERVPRSLVEKAWRFGIDLAAVLYRIYVRAPRHRAVADVEHEREVCELFFYRGRAETTSDPRRLFRELPTGLRRFSRIDPRRIDQACGMYTSCAGIFAYSGLSFAISERMLGIARTLVREDSVRDRFVYRAMLFVHWYLRGDWDGRWTIDEELVEQDLRYGQLWDVTSYLGLDADRRLRRGEFAAAERLLATLARIDDGYGYGFAGTTAASERTALLLERRELAAAARAGEEYHARLHEDALKLFALGMIAKAHLLAGDREAADAAFARAAEPARRMALIPPWHRTTYLLSRLLAQVTALDAAVRAGDRRAAHPLRAAARRAARAAVRTAPKVAKERVEIFRLVGTAAWLGGRPSRAAVWWERSLLEGERLGARPELARTHHEIACRLAARPQASLRGLTPAAHLARARQLFADLGLRGDVDAPASSDHAVPAR